MSQEFPFLRDMPLWLKGPPGRPVPQAQLTEIAESLDITLLFFDRCTDYIRQVFHQLRILQMQPDDRILDALTDDQLEAIVARPLRARTEAELRQIRLEHLASNPVAIDQIFLRLASEPLSEEWLEIHDAECDRRALRLGLGWVDGDAIAATLGSKPQEATMAGSGASRGRGTGSSDDALKRPKPIRLHIAADDSQRVTWQTGTPSDAAAKHLDVEVRQESPYKIRVLVGGIGYVEQGCELTVRWLGADDHVVASADVKNRCVDVILDNTSSDKLVALKPSLHALELRFAKADPGGYGFVARVPLSQQPSSRPGP